MLNPIIICSNKSLSTAIKESMAPEIQPRPACTKCCRYLILLTGAAIKSFIQSRRKCVISPQEKKQLLHVIDF